ncbi:hypothetical protein HHK36_028347 [Tetracentron sinense]|uniref:Uncharacterized protein n=1 Tax=Tetracentron sinense TaxID=13715 RepID=A0A834YJ10_TETSI|nr:hypothetical protein HHK36_028347 [Tetracentron sinense]
MMVDMEKLRLPTLESHSNSVAVDRPLIGAIGPPIKENFRANLATETLLMGEEALIAATAAEAIALAKAAVEVAKDAVMIVRNNPSLKLDNNPTDFPSEADVLLLKRAQLTEMERVGTVGHSLGAESRPDDEYITPFSNEAFENFDPMDEELELLQTQLSESLAVRSQCQTKRRARRARAAEKASANVVCVKSGSSTRKRRVALQDVDYSDPLLYLRGTTSTSRLLTGNEELEL